MRIQITILPIILAFIISFHAQAQAPEPVIDFVIIPSGQFMMGTRDLEEAIFEIPPNKKMIINDEQPAHKVSLAAFEIGKYEITQQQWFNIMGTRPGPDKYWQHNQWKKLPVVSISWNMTQTFIKKLNAISTTYRYRLPTEAEFEYVLRSGSDELRPFDIDDMDQHAWTITNSGDDPHPVGLLKPNIYGVYDTFGNVWEWVNDGYHANTYSIHKASNLQGPDESSDKKVKRGGSYHCPSHMVRSGYRAADKLTTRYSVNGFRLIREKR